VTTSVSNLDQHDFLRNVTFPCVCIFQT